MASPQPPSSPVPAGETPADSASTPVSVAPYDEKLRQFWVRNRMLVTTICVIAIAVIVGKGVWEIIQDRRENSIAADYARLTSDDQLKTFAADNESHLLGGVAYLRVADNAFSANKFAEAIALYAKAAASLKSNVLSHRAAIGSAVSKVLSGDRAGGEAALKAIASDLSQPTSTRAEATYHLAILASESGDATALQDYVTQLSTLSPQSIWTQRVSTLRAEAGLAQAATVPASSPTPEATPASDAGNAPTVTFPSTK